MTKGPPSMGHVVGMGNLVTSGSVILILWDLAAIPASGAGARLVPVGGRSRALRMPPISGFMIATSRSPTSVGCFAPKARWVRSRVPKRFMASGIVGDAPILQARLFEEHGRPLGLDETVSDASCFKVDVHRATYPQELTTTVEVSNPPLRPCATPWLHLAHRCF